MFTKSEIVEGASTGVPTVAFRGCSSYVRTAKPGDEGFYVIRVSGSDDPIVSIHLFVGDELDVALSIDRLRTRRPGVPGRP